MVINDRGSYSDSRCNYHVSCLSDVSTANFPVRSDNRADHTITPLVQMHAALTYTHYITIYRVVCVGRTGNIKLPSTS